MLFQLVFVEILKNHVSFFLRATLSHQISIKHIEIGRNTFAEHCITSCVIRFVYSGLRTLCISKGTRWFRSLIKHD